MSKRISISLGASDISTANKANCICSVSVRVRPLSEQEAEKGSAWKIDTNKIYSLGQGNSNDSTYTLDYVFDSEWNTKAVYDRTTEDIIKKVWFILEARTLM